MGMLPMRETDLVQSELRKVMDESRRKRKRETGERQTCGLFEGSCGFVYVVCLSQNAINITAGRLPSWLKLWFESHLGDFLGFTVYAEDKGYFFLLYIYLLYNVID